jgi:hypothetical protein
MRLSQRLLAQRAKDKKVNKLDAVLGTSAIICLLEDELGADLVEQKIAAAEAGNIKLGASFVGLTELFYITHLRVGKGAGGGIRRGR